MGVRRLIQSTLKIDRCAVVAGGVDPGELDLRVSPSLSIPGGRRPGYNLSFREKKRKLSASLSRFP